MTVNVSYLLKKKLRLASRVIAMSDTGTNLFHGCSTTKMVTMYKCTKRRTPHFLRKQNSQYANKNKRNKTLGGGKSNSASHQSASHDHIIDYFLKTVHPQAFY